jgi:hypothetical protein
MNTKKLTLEDLKLESFLTEIDESKLAKMQGGAGGYNDDGTTYCGDSGECESCDCPTDDYTNGPYCDDGGTGADTNDCNTEDVCIDQTYAEFCQDTNNHLC